MRRCAGAAAAFQIDKPLADPEQEARAQALGHEVRCLVCENRSIAESPSDVAEDLKRVILEMIVEGKSNGTGNYTSTESFGGFSNTYSGTSTNSGTSKLTLVQ